MSEVCAKIHEGFNGLDRFTFPLPPTRLPKNGIYVLFEHGEHGHGTERIVRVGTHTGENQLYNRLKEHFIKENKDRSIFRKNIGRCLLHQSKDPFLVQWEMDRTSKRNDTHVGLNLIKQKVIEQQVTAYIRERFSFVVIEVEGKTDRLRLESRIISTVSLCKECGPSANWLGLTSPRQRIRQSGLWLVNELYKQPLSLSELDELRGRFPSTGFKQA